MIRPFGLRDIGLLWRFQKEGVRLDLPEALISPCSPLRSALAAYLLHRNERAYTCVLDGYSGRQWLRGFAQVRPRYGRAEWDIIYLAPSLDSYGASPAVCRSLVEHLCQEAGEQGVLRLFAKVGDAEQVRKIFESLDFNVYARETIFWCPSSAAFRYLKVPEITLRARRPEDDWGIQQLYLQSTPANIQMAEGFPLSNSAHILDAPRGASESLLRVFSSRRRDEEYVLVIKEQIQGYLVLTRGPGGYGLRLMVHPDHHQMESELLAWGLVALSKYPARPIYCSVRDYEESIRAMLQDYGFADYTAQSLLVKQLAVRVKEPALKLAPALEKRVKTVPTHTCEDYKVGSA